MAPAAHDKDQMELSVYFKEHVSHLLEDVSMAVLAESDDNPVPAMLRCFESELKRNGVPTPKIDTPEMIALREEAEQLEMELKELRAQASPLQALALASASGTVPVELESTMQPGDDAAVAALAAASVPGVDVVAETVAAHAAASVAGVDVVAETLAAADDAEGADDDREGSDVPEGNALVRSEGTDQALEGTKSVKTEMAEIASEETKQQVKAVHERNQTPEAEMPSPAEEEEAYEDDVEEEDVFEDDAEDEDDDGSGSDVPENNRLVRTKGMDQTLEGTKSVKSEMAEIASEETKQRVKAKLDEIQSEQMSPADEQMSPAEPAEGNAAGRPSAETWGANFDQQEAVQPEDEYQGCKWKAGRHAPEEAPKPKPGRRARPS